MSKSKVQRPKTNAVSAVILAAGRSSLLTAESNYTTSKANYRQVIGVEPGRLSAAMPKEGVT